MSDKPIPDAVFEATEPNPEHWRSLSGPELRERVMHMDRAIMVKIEALAKKMRVLDELEPFMESVKATGGKWRQVLEDRLDRQDGRIDAYQRRMDSILELGVEEIDRRIQRLPSDDQPIPDALQGRLDSLDDKIGSLGDDLGELAHDVGAIAAKLAEIEGRVIRLETITGVTHETPYRGPTGEKIDLRYQDERVQEQHKRRMDPGGQLVRPPDGDFGIPPEDKAKLDKILEEANRTNAEAMMVPVSVLERAIETRDTHEQAQSLARGVGAALTASISPVHGSIRELESRQETARKEVRNLARDVTLLIDEHSKKSDAMASRAEAMLEKGREQYSHLVGLMQGLASRLEQIERQASPVSEDSVDTAGPPADTETGPNEPETGGEASDEVSEVSEQGHEGDRQPPAGEDERDPASS